MKLTAEMKVNMERAGRHRVFYSTQEQLIGDEFLRLQSTDVDAIKDRDLVHIIEDEQSHTGSDARELLRGLGEGYEFGERKSPLRTIYVVRPVAIKAREQSSEYEQGIADTHARSAQELYEFQPAA